MLVWGLGFRLVCGMLVCRLETLQDGLVLLSILVLALVCYIFAY